MSAAARTPRLLCIRCGTELDPGLLGGGCPTCAERGLPSNATTDYDLGRLAGEFRLALRGAAPSPARYATLLPVAEEELVSPDAGGTPLLEAPRLAAELGLRRLWIKDESRGPTWSFKDRAASLAAAHARVVGAPGLVVASTGNAAAAACAHARRAGLPALVLFSRGVDPAMSTFVRAYGCPVVAAPTKADRWTLMARCVEELGLYPCSNFADPPVGNGPYAIDGYKPIGYEIYEQLGGRLPEEVYLPVCYGDALWGIWHSFVELDGVGVLDGAGGEGALPALSGGEIQGTLEAALASGSETLGPLREPRGTVAQSIAGGPSTWQALTAVRESGGRVSSVSDGEILAAQALLAGREGIFAETASAVGLAALMGDLTAGRLSADAEVVLVNSSSGLKSVGRGEEHMEPRLAESFEALMEAAGPFFQQATIRRDR